MLIITKESKALPLFKKYKNCVAFSLAKGAKGVTDEEGKLIASYDTLGFLPDEDIINAIKNGDMKLKKVIKKARKAVERPSMDDAGISLGVAQAITMLTANRKAPVIMVIIVDENDPVRTKILTKYIAAIFDLFGIKPVEIKDLYKELKKRKVLKIKKSGYKFGKTKRIREAIARYNYSVKGNSLSKKGADLKKLILCYYELELRQSGMTGLGVNDLDREEAKACVKNLLSTFTATNLQRIDNKKICKKLAKKDKKAVEAYNELREILGTVEGGFDLPKAKYGQEKTKKGEAKGPKMNVDKFAKFFIKKKANRPALIIVYGHILVRLLDYAVGSKEYNGHMKAICEPFGADFAKAYVAAANAYAKAQA